MLSLVNYPYSKEEILGVLHGKKGNRQIRFRYDLLDKNDNKIKELDSVIEGEVSMASLSSIKRTARFRMKDKEDINWLTDRIQPFMELKMPAKVGDAPTPTFTRNSAAYTQDGKQVASGQPRFEQGKFGRGIMIEKGTTNLFPHSKSFEECSGTHVGNINNSNGVATTIGSGWRIATHYNSATIKVSEDGGLFGNKSLSFIHDGSYGWKGAISDSWSIEAGKTYTVSVWARTNIASNEPFSHGYAFYNYNGQKYSFDWPEGFPTQSPGKWVRGVCTFTAIANESGSMYLYGLTDGEDGLIIDYDGILVEQKPYATSFVEGTRTTETLELPTTVLNKNEGAIELWINPTTIQNWNNFFYMSINTGRFLLFFNSTGQVLWDYGVVNSGLATTTGIAQAGQWLHVVMRWSESKGTRELFVNGVLIDSKSFNPPSSLPATVSIVSTYGAIIDDLRISSRARTDEEILAGYQSDSPLPIDEWTTYKLNFEGNLTAKTFLPSQWIEFPLGIFLLSSPIRKDSNQNVYRDVEAYDGLLILRDDKFDSRYTIPSGTNYRQAVIDILASAGITKHNIEQTDKVLPFDVEFEPGTEKLEAVNSLLRAVNFTPIHVDVYGYFTSMTYRSPSIRSAEYTYKDDELSIIYAGMEEELDLFNVPNKWVVVCSSAEQSLMSSYTNSNPNSPTSTVNRGRTIVDYREVQDIADQASLDAYVQRIAFEASQIYGKLTFETAINPLHDYFDVLQIEYSSLGINGKYTETSWTMPLKVGARMKHEVRKVVNI